MNHIGLLFDCPDGDVRGTDCGVKYLTGGLEQGVRITEQVFATPPPGWDSYRLFWMEYFNGAESASAKALRQRFLCLLLGSSTQADALLHSLHETKCNLADLGIYSHSFLQGIGYERLTLIGKAAWLPDMALRSGGGIPVDVSRFLRGSGTLAEETKAVLRLRDGSTALVAQARASPCSMPLTKTNRATLSSL